MKRLLPILGIGALVLLGILLVYGMLNKGTTNVITPSTYASYASEIGIKTDQFSTCMADDKYISQIEKSTAQAQLLGVEGTPTFFINGVKLKGAVPFEVLSKSIDSVLQGSVPPEALGKIEIGDDYAKGDPNAPVTVVEFSDFDCPFCARFVHETMPQIESTYIDTGKVQFVFKNLPLAIHETAQEKAEAVLCAGEQGKFWEMHDTLFALQNH